jgi:hypothetical protein
MLSQESIAKFVANAIRQEWEAAKKKRKRK